MQGYYTSYTESGNFRFLKREDVTTGLLSYAFLLWADVPAVPIAVSKNISSCLLRICPSGKIQ